VAGTVRMTRSSRGRSRLANLADRVIRSDLCIHVDGVQEDGAGVALRKRDITGRANALRAGVSGEGGHRAIRERDIEA
jgi:hypothetical protein